MLGNHFNTNRKMNKCHKDSLNSLIDEGTNKVLKTGSQENSERLRTHR